MESNYRRKITQGTEESVVFMVNSNKRGSDNRLNHFALVGRRKRKCNLTSEFQYFTIAAIVKLSDNIFLFKFGV